MTEISRINHLIKKLVEADIDTQELAALELGQINGNNHLIECHLIEKLNDEKTTFRETIICSLGMIESKKSVPHLIKLLKDVDYEIRWVTVEALGKIKSEEAIPELINSFKREKVSSVKAATIRTLSKFETKETYLVLLEAIKDDDYWVRQDAAIALENITIQSQLKESLNKLDNNNHNGKAINRSAIEKLSDILKTETNQTTLKLSSKLHQDNSVKSSDIDTDTDINTSWKVFRIRRKLEEQFSRNGWVEDINILDDELERSNCRKYYTSNYRDIESLKKTFPDFYKNSSDDEKRFIEIADRETLDDDALQKMKMMIKEHDSEEWEDSLFEISLRLAEVNKGHPYASQRFFKKVVINGFIFLLICFKFKYPLNDKNMVLFQLTSYDCEKPFPPGVNILVKDIEESSVISGEAIDEPPGLELFFTFSSEPRFDIEITLDND
ncbi:MAG: HEAT repeat domain-containing protein [Cyanobacteria bacterium J06648_1]